MINRKHLIHTEWQHLDDLLDEVAGGDVDRINAATLRVAEFIDNQITYADKRGQQWMALKRFIKENDV